MNSKGRETGNIESRYARLLSIGMYAGLGTLVVTYILYAVGVPAPVVSLDRMPTLWGLSSREFQQEAGIPDGWGWLSLLRHGDYLNFIGIVVLAVTSIVCYAAVLPLFMKKKPRIYAVLVALEIVTLIVAASGFISIGH